MTRPNAAAIVIVIALVFAGLASWGAYSYLNKEALKSKSRIVAMSFCEPRSW